MKEEVEEEIKKHNAMLFYLLLHQNKIITYV